MFAADLASGIAVALIPLLYHTVGLAFWQLLLLVFLRALCNTPGGAARQGLLPDLIELAGVGRERANGAYEAIRQIAQLFGTASVGILIALIGTSNMLWLDGVSFLFSATVVFLAVPAAPRATRPVSRQHGRHTEEISAGLRFLVRERVLWAVTVTATLANLIGTGLDAVVLPVYAKTIYGTPFSLGLLFASLFAGYLIGSILYAVFGPQLPRRGTFVVGIALLGAPFLLLALQPPLWVAGALPAVSAILVGPLNPLITVIAQERTPVPLRGRVFGALQAMASVAAPIGALCAGYAVSEFGLRPTLLAMAVFLLGVSGWVARNGALRTLDAQPSHD